MPSLTVLRRACARLSALRASESGIALIEFAVTLPFFFGLAMYGTEVARMAIYRMQVSQLALTLADNASRLGQTDNSGIQPTVNETMIDSVMRGAIEQGKAIDLSANGRVILSSLEHDAVSGHQYFHWQRCQGALPANSLYGDEALKNGLREAWRINGVGPTNPQLTAQPGMAVMVAEVYFHFEGIFGDTFVSPQTFRQEAAFLVRDDRNLEKAVTPGTSAAKSRCPVV